MTSYTNGNSSQRFIESTLVALMWASVLFNVAEFWTAKDLLGRGYDRAQTDNYFRERGEEIARDALYVIGSPGRTVAYNMFDK